MSVQNSLPESSDSRLSLHAMSPPIQQPFALALMICDYVWMDPATSKRTILGTFSSLKAKSFPLRLPTLAVYMSLTDGRGDVPLEIRIVDELELREPIVSGKLTVPMDDPSRVHDGHFIVVDAIFPEPGLYRVQLYACGSLLLERRIDAMVTEYL